MPEEAADKPKEEQAKENKAENAESKQPAVAAAPAAEAPKEKEAAPAKDKSVQRVILLEDHMPQRRLLKMLIERSGGTVLEGENGEDGLKLLKSTGVENIHLIISDVMMPGMDGIRFIATARKEYWNKLPPVIICSARSDRETVDLANKLGCAGYILKPYKTETVMAKLEKALAVPGAATPAAAAPAPAAAQPEAAPKAEAKEAPAPIIAPTEAAPASAAPPAAQ